MVHHRTSEEVRRFDIGKLIVLIILIILLLLSWFRGRGQLQEPVAEVPADTTTTTATTTATTPETSGAATAVPEEEPTVAVDEAPDEAAEEVPPVEIALPVLDAPEGPLSVGEMLLTGTAEPGSRVAILVDGEQVGTAEVGDDGTWSLPIELAFGSQEVVAQTLDSDDSVLNESEPLTIEVPEMAAPELPELGFSLPEFNPFNGFYTWRGTAEPGAEVALIVEGEVAQTTTADADGNWLLSDTFDPGELDIQFAVLDEAGEVAAESEPTSLDLGLRPPRFDLAELGLTDVDLDAPDFEFNLPSGLFTWSGQGEPGTTVEVVVDGESVGTTTVDEDGNWTLEGELEPGEYDLQLRWLDDNGELLSESAAMPVVVLEGIAPTVDLPEDGLEPGTVTLTGTAAPGAEVGIVVNGEVVGTATAADDGTWTLDVELEEGENVIQAQMLDGEGAVALQSEEVTLAVGDVANDEDAAEVVETDGTIVEGP